MVYRNNPALWAGLGEDESSLVVWCGCDFAWVVNQPDFVALSIQSNNTFEDNAAFVYGWHLPEDDLKIISLQW